METQPTEASNASQIQQLLVQQQEIKQQHTQLVTFFTENPNQTPEKLQEIKSKLEQLKAAYVQWQQQLQALGYQPASAQAQASQVSQEEASVSSEVAVQPQEQSAKKTNWRRVMLLLGLLVVILVVGFFSGILDEWFPVEEKALENTPVVIEQFNVTVEDAEIEYDDTIETVMYMLDEEGNIIGYEEGMEDTIIEPEQYEDEYAFVEPEQYENEEARTRDQDRRNAINQIGTAIAAYIADYGKLPTNSVVSIQNIADILLQERGINNVPKDPQENNTFTMNGITAEGDFLFVPMTKNGVKFGWFAIMTKVEVPENANWIAKEGATTIEEGSLLEAEIHEVVPCGLGWVSQGSWELATVNNYPACMYENESQLRYIYMY